MVGLQCVQGLSHVGVVVALVPLAQVDQLAWLLRPQVPPLLAAPSLSFENVENPLARCATICRAMLGSDRFRPTPL